MKQVLVVDDDRVLRVAPRDIYGTGLGCSRQLWIRIPLCKKPVVSQKFDLVVSDGHLEAEN